MNRPIRHLRLLIGYEFRRRCGQPTSESFQRHGRVGASQKPGTSLSWPPDAKGAAFARLDPSRLLLQLAGSVTARRRANDTGTRRLSVCDPSQALADCVEDMLGPFRHDAIDLVAGIDAMGIHSRCTDLTLK
ncbi:uncharacterized protein zgc:174895 [Phycodurus eques]|uniref:uncharacterized protein zgc:174895 n=1 Tax=Phycodurus eques TaxID=693459 RepID=UPI002ACE33AD|nr:uncharacterized protein zgc:174895 [Phycodurus eques]